MKNPRIHSNLLLCLLLIFGLSSCNDDDDDNSNGDELSTAELLVGTWTVTDIDIEAFVGSQTLVEYLVDVEGLSELEAQIAFDLFVDSLEPELTGSLTINADNTYESDFEGGSDTGTWTLSPDDTTLTLLEGTDTIVITINSISESTWDATIGDTFLLDLDDDPGTPDVEVTVVADVILTK